MNYEFKFEFIARKNAPNLHLTIAENEFSHKTIILIHGIGWHGGFYYPLLSRLKDEGFRMIALDLRGHGKSEGERGKHLYEELIEDVLDAIDYAITKYGENVYLFGSSFGASVAYYSAIKNPRIKGLILNNAWDINNLPPTINKKRISRKLEKFSNDPKKMIPLLVMMGFKMSWNLFDNKFRFLTLLNDKLWHREWSVHSWKSFIDYKPDQQDEENFNVPLLVITGENDGMLPLSYTKQVYDNLSTSKKEFSIIKKAGHMIMLEHLNQSIPVITEWMKEN